MALTCPHILMRLPYGKDTKPVDAFNYEEGRGRHRSLQVPVGERGLCAGRAADAVLRAVRLVRGHPRRGRRRPGGRPAGPQLPDRRGRRRAEVPHRNRRSPTGARRNWPTSASFRWCTARAPTTRRSSACSRAQKPKLYDKDAANANARLSAQLPYILAVSRFAHYLKAMMRDKIGSFMSRTDCERFLNHWITNYVTPDDTASPSVKAQPSAARGLDRGHRGSRQARRLPRRRVPAAALPAGRAVGFPAPGGGAAAVGPEVTFWGCRNID